MMIEGISILFMKNANWCSACYKGMRYQSML